MKLTIIKEGTIGKNNYAYCDLDLSFIPSNVHALQWDDESNKKWIEFVDNAQPPENITELPTWAVQCSDTWELLKQAEDEAIAAEEARLLAAKEARLAKQTNPTV